MDTLNQAILDMCAKHPNNPVWIGGDFYLLDISWENYQVIASLLARPFFKQLPRMAWTNMLISQREVITPLILS